MDGFLPKPWTREELERALDVVRAATAHRSASAATPAAPGPPDADDADADDAAVGARLDELFDDLDPVEAAAVRRDVLLAFTDRTRHLLTELAPAAAAGDRATVTAHAHALRGSAGTIGAAGLAALAGSLEEQAATSGRTDLTSLVGRLATSFDRLAPSLARFAAGEPLPATTVGAAS
jgi:HPt (histidine-containing phosphotransfer) domain-containing protein